MKNMKKRYQFILFTLFIFIFFGIIYIYQYINSVFLILNYVKSICSMDFFFFDFDCFVFEQEI